MKFSVFAKTIEDHFGGIRTLPGQGKETLFGTSLGFDVIFH